MTLETTILKGLLDKDRYGIYRPFIDDKIVLPSKEHQLILKAIDEEHDRQQIENIRIEDINAKVGLHVNGHAALPDILAEFQTTDNSAHVFDEVFETLKKRNLANAIALKAINVTEGRETFEELIDFVDENKTTKLASTDDVNIISMDITTYTEEEDGKDMLHWRMQWLNKALGPLRKGNLGHVFAVPETGKTAFWISEITHMAKNTQKPLIVFFNEEDGKEVVYRMYSSALGIPYKQIVNNKRVYAKQFMEAGGNNIIFVDEAPLRMGMMEKVVAKYKPALVVIDNADKVATKAAERRDLEIHNVYKWARELAKEYCPVITVAHADASAYGCKYLDESMMANSKVGKPAEMDFIIGIGREDGESVARYLSLPKNKLRGDKDTVDQLRHGRWPVALQSELSRFTDTANET